MKATTTMGKLAGTALLLSALGVAPQPAGAAVITTGCAGVDFGADCSWSELLAGGTMTIADKLFANFTLSNLAGTPIDTSAVLVDPIDVFLNPGFTLIATAGALTRADGDFTVNDFGFTVNVLPPNFRIKDNTLVVARGAMAGDTSYTSVFETLLSLDLTDVYGNKLVQCTGPACANTTGTDDAVFLPVTEVLIAGGLDVVSDVGGVAEIRSVTMQFSQILPEPGSLALLGLGFAGLAFARRRPAAA